MDSLIRVTNLTKYFPIAGSRQPLQAVKDVSFDIAEAETLGLVGESGSGKTTAGRCLLRLEEPTEGEIYYCGTRISDLNPNRFRSYRSKMQMVFQEPLDSLNPNMTPRQIVNEPLKLHTRMSSQERQERLTEVIKTVGLREDQIDTYPRSLSSGEQQRVSIARAIATNPDFVVLDEPISALAPVAKVAILNLLTRLQQEIGLSYLYISHDLSTVETICHRVAVMYLSQIVESGTKDQVFQNPLHPYSKGLLASVLFPDPTDRRIDKAIQYQLVGEIPSGIHLPPGCYLASRCPVAVPECHEMPQVLREVEEGHWVRCSRVMLSGELGT